MIGDSGTGKSALMNRFTDDIFNPSYISTIGVDFNIKTITHKDKTIKFQIWDTAGQDRFRTLTSTYYRGSGAVIICYDISNRETFNSVGKWLEEAKMFSNSKPIYILCGTKSDLYSNRLVTYSEGELFAKLNGMIFFECSAKSNYNIEEIFNSIAEERIVYISSTPNYNVDSRNKINLVQVKKSKSCCFI
jgi:Ras-related protein Rab-1A